VRVELNPVIVSEAGAWVTDVSVHVAPVLDPQPKVPVRRL